MIEHKIVSITYHVGPYSCLYIKWTENARPSLQMQSRTLHVWTVTARLAGKFQM